MVRKIATPEATAAASALQHNFLDMILQSHIIMPSHLYLREGTMVKSFCSKLTVLLFLLMVSVSCNSSNNKSQLTVPDRTWTLSTIDSGSVGVASSIARDSNDKLHISYYDATSDAVKYISNATGTWSFSTVDTNIGNVAGNVSTAIAVDSTDTVHISYASYSRSKLMYAVVSAGTWTTSTVDSAIIRHTSIAIDSNNNVHISYYDQGTGAYKYATNATGSWITTTLDTSSSEGSSSIAIDSYDKVHMVYMGSSTGSSNDVMYATNASGTWTKTTIVPGRSDSASGVSITRDSQDRIHISYYDAVDTVLMHATNASGAWATEIMDNWAYTGLVSSIAVDPHDNIHVAYSYLAPDGNYYLTYATLVGDTWWSWTLDNVGVMGFYCSITADSNDRPHISYWDGNFSNQGLKYATAE